jgi:hypothetical protein
MPRNAVEHSHGGSTRPLEMTATSTNRPQSYAGDVRHAGSAALDELEPLLDQLRRVPGLIERTRGLFYRGSRAFLHFHEDVSGVYADVRLADEFERCRVQTPDEQRRLLARIGSG